MSIKETNPLDKTLSKICTKCKVMLPLSEFFNHASSHCKTKKTYWCKSCIKKCYLKRMEDPIYAEKIRKKLENIIEYMLSG